MQNPQNPVVTCLWFGDLTPWERIGLQPLAQLLRQMADVEEIEVPSLKDASEISARGGTIWIFSRHWQNTLSQLTLPPSARVFVSVLGREAPEAWLVASYWKKFQANLPTNITLVAHSPLSLRFLTELEGISAERCALLPIPIDEKVNFPKPQTPSAQFTVTALSRFSTEANLNYFLNVGHYVINKEPTIQFQIMGSGPLKEHLLRIAKDLGIASNVRFSDWDQAAFAATSTFLYSPLQNQHFMALLIAGQHGIASISSELPGLEKMIEDGKTGFSFPVNETKPVGEVILRLHADSHLREAIGSNLKKHLIRTLCASSISPLYLKLLNRESGQEPLAENFNQVA